MKKFGVYYKTNVESFMIAEFDTLAEAKEYCTNETKGCIPVSEDIPALTITISAFISRSMMVIPWSWTRTGM